MPMEHSSFEKKPRHKEKQNIIDRIIHFNPSGDMPNNHVENEQTTDPIQAVISSRFNLCCEGSLHLAIVLCFRSYIG